MFRHLVEECPSLLYTNVEDYERIFFEFVESIGVAYELVFDPVHLTKRRLEMKRTKTSFLFELGVVDSREISGDHRIFHFHRERHSTFDEDRRESRRTVRR